MQRRNFLRNTGMLVAGGMPLAKVAEQAVKEPKGSRHLLITSASSKIAQGLVSGLKDRYQIRLTEQGGLQTDFEFVECALGHDTATNSLVRGMDAIVDVGEPLPGKSDTEQIDRLTRSTYNLLWAAAEERVPRVVFLSTLDLMTQYDASFTVSETWRPLPPCQPSVLAKHLGEFTCREFAREGKTSIVVLRLGKVVRTEAVKEQPFDPLWVDERDVIQAVSCALAAKVERWSVFHVQPDNPRCRFAVTRAKDVLGYKPQFNW